MCFSDHAYDLVHSITNFSLSTRHQKMNSRQCLFPLVLICRITDDDSVVTLGIIAMEITIIIMNKISFCKGQYSRASTETPDLKFG